MVRSANGVLVSFSTKAGIDPKGAPPMQHNDPGNCVKEQLTIAECIIKRSAEL
jgi:hypothetical protein